MAHDSKAKSQRECHTMMEGKQLHLIFELHRQSNRDFPGRYREVSRTYKLKTYHAYFQTFKDEYSLNILNQPRKLGSFTYATVRSSSENKDRNALNAHPY